MRTWSAMLTVAIVAAGCLVALAEPPKPRIVPASWELGFEFQKIQPITLRLPGEAKPQTFWYMRYKVTNNTGKEQIFVPDFVLYTDTGEIIRSGEKVSSEVFTAIQQLYNDPLLMDQAAITGKILQGDDNFKSGVAIWRDIDPKARKVDIFIGGLSGEREKVKLPEPVKSMVADADGKLKEVATEETILSKTLHVQYLLPGEAQARAIDTPQQEKKEWVMR